MQRSKDQKIVLKLSSKDSSNMNILNCLVKELLKVTKEFRNKKKEWLEEEEGSEEMEKVEESGGTEGK